ncbi:MAG: hybrid sensor histidine kinase/response regulator [Myxococcales bacterium]|nr:MAG: hybrid sensor histidine kinase/response regulator [Myxococcales bacterium]
MGLLVGYATKSTKRSLVLTGSVWIVEDSPLEAEMARRPLAHAFQVELFADGPAMIERLSTAGPPQVLVLDWRLPGMSGIEVLRFVRGTLNETSLPILMLTVQHGKQDIVEGLSAGANDYLAKPYDDAELLARVTGLHRLRQLSDALRNEQQQAREATQRAEQANRSKDDFLATVSHELRTPLNAISGWVSLLRSGALPPERVSDALETIDRNVRAQARLIEDLLDVSRITSGKLQLSLEPTDMTEVVAAAIKALRPGAEAKRLAIRTEVASELPTLMGDGARLQQVVWNLLVNALKFTPGGGSIYVALRAVAGGVELVVEDDGQGIAPETLPHVFDRFQQAQSSFTRSHGGLGLGLAIVRHLVDLHGGRVSAASAGLGQGSAFTVFLPSMPGSVTATAPRSRSQPPDALQEVLRGTRVLLVDDDEDGREVTALLLRQHGAHVETATSARHALAELDRSLPDVLLSDIGMPEEDGLSLLRKVRLRTSAAGGSIPAIAITAYARSEDRAQSLLAGFDAYVTKPVEAADLLEAIAKVTGKSARRSVVG